MRVHKFFVFQNDNRKYTRSYLVIKNGHIFRDVIPLKSP